MVCYQCQNSNTHAYSILMRSVSCFMRLVSYFMRWTIRRQINSHFMRSTVGNKTKLSCVHVASRDQDSSEGGMKK